MDDEVKNEIRKVALQNAYEHEGKTQDKIVLSKILGTKPEFRSKVKEIIGDISEIVSSVNQLSFDEQKKEIEDRITSYNVCYTKLLRWDGTINNGGKRNVPAGFYYYVIIIEGKDGVKYDPISGYIYVYREKK